MDLPGVALLRSIDDAVWELGEALTDFPEADLWRRPHPRLLSAGEIACHLAYWEAKSFVTIPPESPLVASAEARYYSVAVEAEPLTPALVSAAVYEEIKRVHGLCREEFLRLAPDLAEENPRREGWTWEATVRYQAFHFAYHTGQIYSVRHLFGHETVDN